MTSQSRPVAVVTGISKGFGLAIARDLSSAGWHVIGNGRSAEALDEAAAELGGANASVTTVVGDVTDEAHLENLVQAGKEHGDLRLVVNNVAITSAVTTPRVNELEADDLAKMFATNVIAPLRLITIAMREADPEVIINVTSSASVVPTNRFGGYGATKSALDHFTAVLTIENPDTRFYALDPGPMATELFQTAYPNQDASIRPRPDDRAAAARLLATRQPLSGRFVAKDLIAMYS